MNGNESREMSYANESLFYLHDLPEKPSSTENRYSLCKVESTFVLAYTHTTHQSRDHSTVVTFAKIQPQWSSRPLNATFHDLWM